MKKVTARAVARQSGLSQEAFVGLWSTAMWVLAAVYLLATFSVR